MDIRSEDYLKTCTLSCSSPAPTAHDTQPEVGILNAPTQPPAASRARLEIDSPVSRKKLSPTATTAAQLQEGTRYEQQGQQQLQQRQQQQEKKGSSDGTWRPPGEEDMEGTRQKKRWRGFSKREVVMLLVQCMKELGCHRAAKVLEEESGISLEPLPVMLLHEAVLQGKWDDVYIHLKGLPLRAPLRKACWFLAMEQKYFEALLEGDEREAVRILREDLQPAVFDASTLRRLQACSALLMHADPTVLLASVSVLSDTLRSNLWMRMKHLLPPALCPPSSRLAVLLAYALRHQTLLCLYHNTDAPIECYSLLQDHHCHHYPVAVAMEPHQLANSFSDPVKIAAAASTFPGTYQRVVEAAAAPGHAETSHTVGVFSKGAAHSSATEHTQLFVKDGTVRQQIGQETLFKEQQLLRQQVEPMAPACGLDSLPVQLCQSLELHADEVWVVAPSPLTGRYFASGCKDRSVALWKVVSSRSRIGRYTKGDSTNSTRAGYEMTPNRSYDGSAYIGEEYAEDRSGCERVMRSFSKSENDCSPSNISRQNAVSVPGEDTNIGRRQRRPRLGETREMADVFTEQEEAFLENDSGREADGSRSARRAVTDSATASMMHARKRSVGDEEKERGAEAGRNGETVESEEETATCEAVWRAVAHEDAVSYISWSRDERLLVSAGQEGAVCVWDRRRGKVLAKADVHSHQAVTAVGWLRSCREFVSGGSDKRVVLSSLVYQSVAQADVTNKTDSAARPVAGGWRIVCDWSWSFGCRVQDLVVLKDGIRFVCVTADKQLRITDTRSKRELIALPFTEVIYSICASALSNQILLNFADARPVIRLWDVDERRSVQRYRGHQQGCYVIRSAFGGVDEAFVVSGSEDSQIYIWHRFYGSLLHVLSGHASTVSAVAWTHLDGGKWMVSASDDLMILFWHARLPNRSKGKLEQASGRFSTKNDESEGRYNQTDSCAGTEEDSQDGHRVPGSFTTNLEGAGIGCISSSSGGSSLQVASQGRSRDTETRSFCRLAERSACRAGILTEDMDISAD